MIKKYFQDGYSARCKIEKKDIYEFELTEKDIKEAKKRKYNNQYYFQYGIGVIGLYSHKNKLVLTYYHSSDTFDELKDNHKEKEHGENYCYCTCGKRFVEKDYKTAKVKLNKHIQKIKEVLK